MQALIQGTRIAQIVADGEEFEVHASLTWVDAPDGVTTEHTYEDGVFVSPPPVPPPPTDAEQIEREMKQHPGFRAMIRREVVQRRAAGEAGLTAQDVINELTSTGPPELV